MSTASAATDERASALDRAAYWLAVIGVHLLVGVLFFYSAKGKLFDDNGHAPPAMKSAVRGHLPRRGTGHRLGRVIIGAMNFGIFLLIVLSIVRRECLPVPAQVAAARRPLARLRRATLQRPDPRATGWLAPGFGLA